MAAHDHLNEHIKSFTPYAKSRGWHTCDGAGGNCEMATNYFLDHAEDAAHKEGLHTEVARLRGPKFDVSKGSSYSQKTDPTEIEHVVPVIDGFIVDWTMRQFNPDADFPHVEEEYSYKSKWKGAGGEWA